jgi:NAD+ synthase
MIQAAAAAEYIVHWLRNYAESAGMRGFVVGVSGGIDSAVTSALCAATGFEVAVCDLPIRQAAAERDRGRAHMAALAAKWPGVQEVTVDLGRAFDALVEALPATDELAQANARARLRMTALYAVAAGRQALVAGTGNKVEDFGVGFYTKYGDGGVDLSPIADLLKSEVYALGAHLGVSADILSAPPTDGLWGDGRTDEDALGATYDELEWAMEREAGRPRQGGPVGIRGEEVRALYRRLHAANRHKMVPIPVCILPDSLR